MFLNIYLEKSYAVSGLPRQSVDQVLHVVRRILTQERAGGDHCSERALRQSHVDGRNQAVDEVDSEGLGRHALRRVNGDSGPCRAVWDVASSIHPLIADIIGPNITSLFPVLMFFVLQSTTKAIDFMTKCRFYKEVTQFGFSLSQS